MVSIFFFNMRGGEVRGVGNKTRKRTVKIDIDKMTTTSVKEAGEDRWELGRILGKERRRQVLLQVICLYPKLLVPG